MRTDPIRSDPIRSDPIRSDPIRAVHFSLSQAKPAVDWPLAQALDLRALSVAGGRGVAQDHAQARL